MHSAGGGVGSALIQLCKLHNLHVTGVVGGSHKVEYVRQLGANAVIDKSTQSLWLEAKRLCPDGYDLVFDANGPETLAQSYAHLKPTGKLLVYGFQLCCQDRVGASTTSRPPSECCGCRASIHW